MSGHGARRIEAGVDVAAALTLASASAYAAAATIADPLAPAAGVIVFAACLSALRGVGRTAPGFAPPQFVPRALEVEACPELLLQEQDRLAPIDADSRVVRLFDSAAMGSPGPARGPNALDFDVGTSPTAPPDAAQALYDALAQLRRSLR